MRPSSRRCSQTSTHSHSNLKMAKRAWTQVDNSQSPSSSLSRGQGDLLPEQLLPHEAKKRAKRENQRPNSETIANEEQRAVREGGAIALQQKIPVISRKVKACATCRKQKVSILSVILRFARLM